MSEATRKRKVQARRLAQAAARVRIDGDVAYLQMTRGYETIIDATDLPLVGHRSWHPTFSKSKVYAVSRRPLLNKKDRLHNVLMSPPQGFEVDHINRDSLDNRRSNLRICTRGENAANALYANKTGFKGVTFVDDPRRVSKWRAGCKGAQKYFATAEQAARAYDEMARARYGEFAGLNFPTKGDENESV